MARYHRFFVGLALVSSSLQAWSHRSPPIPKATDTNQNTPTVYAFPLYAKQRWFMEESYLLMKPFQGELDYATKTLFVRPDDHTRSTNIKIKKPNFEWNSGARAALGVYLPASDRWDFKVAGTYFYGETSSHASANTDVGEAINPDFLVDIVFAFPASKTHFRWQLNYFTADFEIGREYQMTSRIVVHPFFGVRSAFIYQNTHTHDFAPEPDEVPPDQRIANYKLKLNQDVYGAGPRIGTRFNYSLSNHWQILGNFAASFLYAHYDVREQFTNTLSEPSTNTTIVSVNKAKDRDNMIKTNLEGSLGLGWESWVNKGKVRIAPFILFEGTFWLDFNKIFTYQIPSVLFLTTQFRDFDTRRRHGNFGLIGASFNFHVDF